ncbi:MAG: energy transducer TonB [Pseudomonadota bacterium]
MYPLIQTSNQDKKEKREPITRVPPKYPRKAAEQGIEGFVSLKFDIDKQGNIRNIRTTSTIEPLFVKSSRRALSQWKYQTSDKPTYDHQVTLDYKLQKTSKNLLTIPRVVKTRKQEVRDHCRKTEHTLRHVLDT